MHNIVSQTAHLPLLLLVHTAENGSSVGCKRSGCAVITSALPCSAHLPLCWLGLPLQESYEGNRAPFPVFIHTPCEPPGLGAWGSAWLALNERSSAAQDAQPGAVVGPWLGDLSSRPFTPPGRRDEPRQPPAAAAALCQGDCAAGGRLLCDHAAAAGLDEGAKWRCLRANVLVLDF